MEMKHIEKGLLIERYLRGDLSTEEEAAFEEVLLESPELLDQLEAAERLQGGLRDLNAVESATESVARGGAAAALFASPRFAMAASFLMAVSVLFAASMYRQNQSLEAELATSASAPTLVQALYTVRSAPDHDPVNVVTPLQGGQVVLLVDPGFETYDAYRGTLFRMSDGDRAEPVHRLEGLQPGYEEMLALGLPARLLSPGRYEIHIEGRVGDSAGAPRYEPVNRLSFEAR
jgi:hypothetical protein